MFFSQQRAALIRQAEVCCRGIPASAGSLAIFSPENSALVFVFEALDCNISLMPRSWLYYITVGEGWQWKLWQHGSEWLSKWTALCLVWVCFQHPAWKREWLLFPAKCWRLQGHFKSSVGQCYQAAESLLVSVSRHYSSWADCRRGLWWQIHHCVVF